MAGGGAPSSRSGGGARISAFGNDRLAVWTAAWADAALLIDEPNDFDETLYIMELATLQLAELEAYDRLLDDALERSYRDLGEQPLRSRGDILRELREIRIDMARRSGFGRSPLRESGRIMLNAAAMALVGMPAINYKSRSSR